MPNSKVAPECDVCGAAFGFVDAWTGPSGLRIPAYYKRTCACLDPLAAGAAVAPADPAPEDVEAREEATVQAWMLRRGVPRSLVHHRLRDFPGVDIPPARRNVFIYGPNGVGKSALSAALFREWVGGEWVSAYRILSRIKATFRRRGGDTEEDVIDSLVEVPVLVIDDLGAEGKSEFGLATIYEVVKERCESNVVTIVTSNRTLTEIDKDESRLASRLGAFHLISMAGKDRRLTR